MNQTLLLNGRYRILQQLGAGNMGNVYLVEDLKLCGKQWAIKKWSEEDRARQLAEAEFLSRIEHVHAPRAVDFFVAEDGAAYLVMDRIKGETLQAKFERAGKQLSVRETLAIATQVCDLYIYLHEQHQPPIIHRDLKPDNIMIDEKGLVTVIDFGIARESKESQMNDTLPVASLGFASPEQWQGAQTTPASDLYSLGALLYFLLSGGQYVGGQRRVDFSHQTGIPIVLVPLLVNLLQVDPQKRPPSATVVKTELHAIVERLQDDERMSRPAQQRPPLQTSTRVYACRGVAGGCGCTHAVLLLANSMAHVGKRVLVVEMNERPVLRRLLQMQGAEERSGEFVMKHVTYICEAQSLEMANWLHVGYDALLLDMGSDPNTDLLAEFARADVPLLVAFGGLLRVSEWQNFIEIHRTSLLNLRKRLHFACMLSANEADAQFAVQASSLSRDILHVPLCHDPFHPSDYLIEMVLAHFRLVDDEPLQESGNRIREWFARLTGRERG